MLKLTSGIFKYESSLYRNSEAPQIARSNQKLNKTPEVINPRFREAIVSTTAIERATYKTAYPIS